MKLHTSFKVPRPQERIVAEPPTVDDVVKVAKHVRHLGAVTFFILLAETGLRPSEVLSLKVSDVDLVKRRVIIGKVTQSKKAYITFLHPEIAEFIGGKYMRFREWFVSKFSSNVAKLGISVGEWRVFPPPLRL